MAGFTPGKWESRQVQYPSGLTGYQVYTLVKGIKTVVCDIEPRPWLVAVSKENAKLLAQAPKMLEALEQAAAYIGDESAGSMAFWNAYNEIKEALPPTPAELNAGKGGR